MRIVGPRTADTEVWRNYRRGWWKGLVTGVVVGLAVSSLIFLVIT